MYNNEEMQIIHRYFDLKRKTNLLDLELALAGGHWLTKFDDNPVMGTVCVFWHACGSLDDLEKALVEFEAGGDRREAINESQDSLEKRKEHEVIMKYDLQMKQKKNRMKSGNKTKQTKKGIKK